MNSEYGGGATSVERGWHSRWQTQELRRHDRVAGYIYTETTLIVDITPVAPGRDMVVDGDATMPVRASHHGADLLSGRLRVAWTGVFTPTPPDSSELWTDVADVRIDAKPFAVTEPINLIVTPPGIESAARLHIAFVGGGRSRTHTAVDIVSS